MRNLKPAAIALALTLAAIDAFAQIAGGEVGPVLGGMKVISPGRSFETMSYGRCVYSHFGHERKAWPHYTLRYRDINISNKSRQHDL